MDLEGCTEIIQHFKRLIYEDWRSLEEGRLGILLPGWDLNYYVGRKAKVIQLLPTPFAPPPPDPRPIFLDKPRGLYWRGREEEY